MIEGEAEKRPAALWNWSDLPPARDDEFVQCATVPTDDPVSLHFGAGKPIIT